MESIDFESAIEELQRPQDVWNHLVAFVRERNVMRVGYHHIPPPAAPDAGLLRVENDGFAEELLEQYLNARAKGLAVLAMETQRSTQPVYLDELEKAPDMSPQARMHIAGYRKAGVVNGLALQAFGPNGRNAIFAIELDHDTPRLPPETLLTVRWACQMMHLRYCALILPTLGTLPSLSTREVEVLTWVARGKSNALIGEILGISAHTVDAHLRRIYLKLGVFDRISAALRALGFGLIRLDA